jgi:hypothetical protein
MPLSILGNEGTLLVDNEIITYNSVSNNFTNKLIDSTRDKNYSGYFFPPKSLLSGGTGITGTYSITDSDYAIGTYSFEASSITADYHPSLAFSNYNIQTTLSSTVLISDTGITVASTTNFPSTGTLTINSEVMTYAAKTSTRFTGLTRATPLSHTNGSTVYNHNYNNVGWRSNGGYDSVSGAYTGSTLTFSSGVTHYGEYLQISLRYNN